MRQTARGRSIATRRHPPGALHRILGRCERGLVGNPATANPNAAAVYGTTRRLTSSVACGTPSTVAETFTLYGAGRSGTITSS